MTDLQSLVETVRGDGFVVVRGFFPPDVVARAHAELEAWFQKDVEERRAKGVTEATFAGVAGSSQLTRPSHLLLDVYGKSPTFDSMFERILTDPLSRGLLRAVVGERFKMRGYNIRRMTGAYDPPPAHEWHRDSRGEFCIGVFLTDVSPRENAATALVPGSHRFPYDPRWNCLFSEPYRGLEFFLRHNPHSRRLAQEALREASGAYGRRGDFYIFLNDVWHGREPNLHGAQTMVALLGAFPTEFPYPDKVPMPPREVIERLSPVIRDVVRQDQPPNTGKDTLIHAMLRERRPPKLGDLFWKARAERKVADVVSAPLLAFRRYAPAVRVRLVHAAKLSLHYGRRYAPAVRSRLVHGVKLSFHYGRLYPWLALRTVYRAVVRRSPPPEGSSRG